MPRPRRREPGEPQPPVGQRARKVDTHVLKGARGRRPRHRGAGAGIGERGLKTDLADLEAELDDLRTGFERAQRHFDGGDGRDGHCGVADGALLGALLRHPHRRQVSVEGGGISVDRGEEAILDLLAPHRDALQRRLLRLEAAFGMREVRHHRREAGGERPGVSGDGAAARCRRVGGELVGEASKGHARERRSLGHRLESRLDDRRSRIERLDFGEPQRPLRNVNQGVLRHSGRAPHAREVVPPGGEQSRSRHQPDELRAGHPQAVRPCPSSQVSKTTCSGVASRSVTLIEIWAQPNSGIVQPTALIPASRARIPDLGARGILQRLALGVEPLLAFLADLAGDAGREPLVDCVQVDVVGDEERPGAEDRGSGTRQKGRRAEIGLPDRIRELRRQPFVFAGPDVGEVAPGGGRWPPARRDRPGSRAPGPPAPPAGAPTRRIRPSSPQRPERTAPRRPPRCANAPPCGRSCRSRSSAAAIS